MTSGRPDVARAFGRILSGLLVPILAMQACAPASPTQLLPATETVIGRAAWRGGVALLTDAPALITIDPRTGATARRIPIAPPDRELSTWGLGESGEELFTVSRFSTLVRVSPDGTMENLQTLDRPITNLFDLPDGMAAQLSGEAAGAALAVRLSDRGRIMPFPSPARRSLGLLPAEENLLHLLSCSVPPRVVCWLPNDNLLLTADDSGLDETVRLTSLQAMPLSDFIARLDRRLIIDALTLEDGGYAVLHEERQGTSKALSEFNGDGRNVGAITKPGQSIRMLVHAEGNEIQALDDEGRLVRIGRR